MEYFGHECRRMWTFSLFVLCVPFAVANPGNVRCNLTTVVNNYNLRTSTATMMGAAPQDVTNLYTVNQQNSAGKVYASSTFQDSELTIVLGSFEAGMLTCRTRRHIKQIIFHAGVAHATNGFWTSLGTTALPSLC
jgi:hypothetical protein